MWPLRLRPGHLNLCLNCLRIYKRSRAPSHQVRKWHLKKAYGTTPEWVQKQLVAQKDACAICEARIKLPKGGASEKGEAVVDHDHQYKFVRALLCGTCNRGLGNFKDDANMLRRAAAYIEKHAKTLADADAFLASISNEMEPVKRGPRAQEEKHDPDESIDSIVSRMGGEVIDVPLLAATSSSSRGGATISSHDLPDSEHDRSGSRPGRPRPRQR